METNKNRKFTRLAAAAALAACLLVAAYLPQVRHGIAAPTSRFRIDIYPQGYIPPTPTSTPPGGGGGGGGGAVVLPPSSTTVSFSGKAYPLSKVTVLKDGQVAITTISGPDANFYVQLTGLQPASYNFSVYSEDAKSRRSAPFSFPAHVTAGANTSVTGIFLAPTVDVDKSEVRRGDNLVIFGQTVPNSQVTIAMHSEQERFFSAKADTSGAYLYTLNTADVEAGRHSVKSKAVVGNEASEFGVAVEFTVGGRNQAKPEGPSKKGDLNGDGRVNLVDFSIAAYWYKRSLLGDIVRLESERLNGDGAVNLVDFSIMAYFWTG